MSGKLEVGNPVVTTKTNILDIDVPVQMEKAVSTGVTLFNALCAGDGMIPSTVMLLTGLPGLGKTTLALQLADAITSTGNVALFNTCEESLYQVRRTVKRLKLEHGFIPAYESEVGAMLAQADLVRLDNPGKQMFLFVDSLQTMEVAREPGERGRGHGQQTMSVDAAWKIAAWCKKNYTIAIIVGQVTKDGTFAGKQEIKHALDAHLHLEKDCDRKSSSYGERIAVMEKNRFGVSGLYYSFDLDESGVTLKAV